VRVRSAIGDVFTRDAAELLDPRPLRCQSGADLLTLHDAGAYGAAMSSSYVSTGRAPQVWLENGRAFLIARRETVEDITRNECLSVRVTAGIGLLDSHQRPFRPLESRLP